MSRARQQHELNGQPDRVPLLIADAHVRVVGADGSLVRELILDPDRDYQPAPTLVAMS
jgi:hypothetical protein